MSDTIRWREWSGRAFADAAAGSKPILLSLITAWSEECSAMDQGTFALPAVVAIVHNRFIPVRVDADRRPDVNERYNLGGWPTTALLTPEGDVLSGGTYFGPDHMIALLTQTADTWRDRAAEIRARAKVRLDEKGAGLLFPANHQKKEPGPFFVQPDPSAWLRSLLIDQFDAVNGGFGSGSKLPHAPALVFALALATDDSDETMGQIADVTLEQMAALWDVAHGGFYRYAEAADWSRPGTEKTLEDNAALLEVYLDAAMRWQSENYRNRAAELVRWVRTTLADQSEGGFFNSQAAVSRTIDRTMYVDRNAAMVTQFLRAASFFEDPWLRDFALKSLEVMILPGYTPGNGVAHTHDVRGLLGDQVRAASALIWAHVFTGQLPYSMLAAELLQFALRAMWDDHAGCFRDRATGSAEENLGLLAEPVRPFALNCEAACVLDRLSTMTGDENFRNRALSVLAALAPEYQQHALFGASYALAVREVIERRPPAGLELSHVDWHLDKD